MILISLYLPVWSLWTWLCDAQPHTPVWSLHSPGISSTTSWQSCLRVFWVLPPNSNICKSVIAECVNSFVYDMLFVACYVIMISVQHRELLIAWVLYVIHCFRKLGTRLGNTVVLTSERVDLCCLHTCIYQLWEFVWYVAITITYWGALGQAFTTVADYLK